MELTGIYGIIEFENTNSKYQITNKSQTPMFNDQNFLVWKLFGNSNFGHWGLFGIWNLIFGI